jgi:hypothetical protein
MNPTKNLIEPKLHVKFKFYQVFSGVHVKFWFFQVFSGDHVKFRFYQIFSADSTATEPESVKKTLVKLSGVIATKVFAKSMAL